MALNPVCVSGTELPVRIELSLIGDTLILISAPKKDQCHVLPACQLFVNRTVIRHYKSRVSTDGISFSIDLTVNPVVGDSFGKRIRECLTCLKSFQKVIDS